jgi:hypothetical protein
MSQKLLNLVMGCGRYEMFDVMGSMFGDGGINTD